MDRAELYDKIAERKSKPKDFEPYDGGNGRVNKAVRLIRAGTLRNTGVLLDVGGGIGDLGYATRDLFEQRIVLDISWKNLEAAAEKGNQIICGDVDKFGLASPPPAFCSEPSPIPDGSVDLVCALDFIEHIVDPESFARECFRVLKPGGDVFVNTPNIQYFQHLESLLCRGIFPHTSGDREVYHGGHLAFFCRTDMEVIFTSAGFIECEQIKDEEGYQNPPEMFVKFLSPRNQKEYFDACMKLGNPNLLFKCRKPQNI